ncbi:helix-turn-helix domain-containing protein [Saccharopolyspora pogona]|uniref:helix-turn-helix domain-containing protein n=1 Tax=Saccharopolyspora pogona TaxID=333966 RepID=UPI00168589F6|nr:helix-turn-helix domain-containing protein [Saccharopolyspora pogona]
MSAAHFSPEEIPNRLLYPIKEAMVLLSMSRSTIYEQLRAGRLRSVTQGASRLIPASALNEYVSLLEKEAQEAASAEAA